MSNNLNNVFIIADNRCIIFASQSADGHVPQYRDAQGTTPVQENDLWFDIDGECIRKYMNTGTGLRWQSPGVFSNSKYNGVQDSLGPTINITDLYNSKADVIPQVIFSYGPNRTTMYSIISQNDDLYFTKADGSVVLTLKADGDALFSNNVTVVGDLFADDVSYDVNQCNILKVADAIQHVGNETNQIVFAADKMTLATSGNSIVVDSTLMTNNIALNGDTTINANSVNISGDTTFSDSILDVQDIYLRNHVHHYNNANTRIGFPVSNTISMRCDASDVLTLTKDQATLTLTKDVGPVTGFLPGENGIVNYIPTQINNVNPLKICYGANKNINLSGAVYNDQSKVAVYGANISANITGAPLLAGVGGVFGNITTDQISGTITGMQSYISHNPTTNATVPEIGFYNINSQFGVNGTGITSNITKCTGFLSQTFFANTGTGNTINVTNLEQFTNSRFFRVGVAGLTTNVTNLYGLRLIAPTVAGTTTITNNYAISSEDSAAINYFNGKVGIKTNAPTGALDINENLFRVRTAKTLASATATGNQGEICWDASYIYVCTATNTWKRSVLGWDASPVNILSASDSAYTTNQGSLGAGTGANVTTYGNIIQAILSRSTYNHQQGELSGCTLDTANNRFNITSSGYFLLTFSGGFLSLTATGNLMGHVFINGSQYSNAPTNTVFWCTNGIASVPLNTSVAANINYQYFTLNLNVGDNIDLRFRQFQSSSSTGYQLSNGSYISLQKIR